MAITQETILNFLVDHGGKAKNSELLNAFNGILNGSDATEKKHNRELFKMHVNSVAVVKEIEDAKYIVIKKKYRHLVKGDVAFTRQNIEFGESSDCSNTSSASGTTSEFCRYSHHEVGKILHSDIDNNNMPIVSITNDHCLNSNVFHSPSELPLQSKLSPSIEGGAAFAFVAVNTQSNVQGDELQAKQFGSSLTIPRQGTPESTQKPYMLPLRMPPSQLNTAAPVADCKDLYADKEVDPYRSPRTKRRQMEESVAPDSPQMRRGYRTTKPSDESKYSETIPLDPTEHAWLVNSAAGQWTQVYGLLLEDSQLAEKKDFISGFTALHWAAKSGKSDMVCKIIEVSKRAGTEIDVNAKTHGGYTPLHIAAIHGQECVIVLLVRDYGANTNIRDNSGKKPYHYLLKGTPPEAREMLGEPQVSQETNHERNEDDHFPELPRGFNTLSRLFQPYMGHKKKPKRPVLGYLNEDVEDEHGDNAFKRRPLSDFFL